MKVLLDTHVWLWLQVAPERLAPEAHDIVDQSSNDLYLSAASAWEIAIKYALGKLALPEPPSGYVPSRMQASGTLPLAVELRHALHVAALPPHHRDPFDRLLIAQAQLDDLLLVTADRELEPYGVRMVTAGRAS